MSNVSRKAVAEEFGRFTETYKVAEGDSLFKIADEILKKADDNDSAFHTEKRNRLVEAVYEHNKETIGKNRRLLRAGQLLEVPPSRIAITFTVKEGGSLTTLGRIIKHHYADWLKIGPWKIANKIRFHPRNKDLISGTTPKLPNSLKLKLKPTFDIYLPDVSPERGKKMDIPYDFYQDAIWLSRIGSLETSIDETIEMLSEIIFSLEPPTVLDSPSSTPTPTYIEVDDEDFDLVQLKNLRTHSENLKLFVEKELEAAIKLLLPSKWKATRYRKYPPINLIREALRRASIDIEIVQRALVQRMRVMGELSKQATMLIVMDKMAFKAVAPFRERLGLDKAISPITYFSEHTHIRRVPHTRNIILLGVSYAHIAASLKGNTLPAYELMAIPHEVGHFVYHHATVKGDKEQRKFVDYVGEKLNEKAQQHSAMERYLDWAEEIFADVYGCYVSGALTAIGMQALLVTTSDNFMEFDDGEHPAAIIRPFIISAILRKLVEKGLRQKRTEFDVPGELELNWVRMLQYRGYLPTHDPSPDAKSIDHAKIECTIRWDDLAPQQVTIKQVLQAVQPMIDLFVDMMADNASQQVDGDSAETISTSIPWDKPESGKTESLQVAPSLREFDVAMLQLTSEEFANKSVPGHQEITTPPPTPELPEDSLDAEEVILNYFEDWGDSGPSGFGNHP